MVTQGGVQVKYVNNVFRQLVQKGANIEYGDTSGRPFVPRNDTQRTVIFELYATTEQQRDFVTDKGMSKVCTVEVPCRSRQDSIWTEVRFDSTELLLRASNKSTGETRDVTVSFEF